MATSAPHLNGTGDSAAFESLQRLNKNAEALRKGDSRARDAMIADCFSLIADLETPNETFIRLTWPYMIQPTVARLGSDMKIFETLSSAGKPLHTTDLAAPVSASLPLTRKILKTLASFHVIKEVDTDLWASTGFAELMASDVSKQALEFIVPYSSQIVLKTPEFLKEKQYQFSDNALDTTAQFYHGLSGKTHFYEIMRQEGRLAYFESLMRVLWDKRVHWSAEALGYYPVRQRLLEGASKDSDAVFLVDVGGGQGQDFPRLFENIPESDIPGRLVLQDQPDVINSISEDSLPPRIEKMSYDFYTQQPITGARVYFMHSIIHNYPDNRAKLILQQVARAMKKGYSKLLLWDNVMPDKGASTNTMCLDFIMVAFYAAGQRTEQEWRALVEDPEVGLKVTDIVRYNPQDQAVIELELA